jgi:hypothetical protein
VLNAILKRLNGHGSEVESLEAAHSQLAQDLAAAQEQLQALQQERKQALLDDLSDPELDKLERKIERIETRLEKLRAAFPGLEERIERAKATARASRWQALLTAGRSAADKFVELALATEQAHTAYAALRSQAEQEGFGHQLAANLPATPNLNGNALLAHDLLTVFARALLAPVDDETAAGKRPVERKQASTAPKRAVWRPAIEKWSTVPRGESLSHAVRLSAIGEPVGQLTMMRSSDDLRPLGEREVRAKVLAPSGWSPARDAQQTHSGQVIVLPLRSALEHEKRGLVEILQYAAPAASQEPSQEP